MAKAHLGDADAVLAAAEAALRSRPQNAAALRDVAAAAAMAAEQASSDAHGALAVRALACLAEISKTEARQRLADNRFDGLRTRADFVKLQAEVGDQ